MGARLKNKAPLFSARGVLSRAREWGARGKCVRPWVGAGPPAYSFWRVIKKPATRLASAMNRSRPSNEKIATPL